jgi:hypothetical protein
MRAHLASNLKSAYSELDAGLSAAHLLRESARDEAALSDQGPGANA